MEFTTATDNNQLLVDVNITRMQIHEHMLYCSKCMEVVGYMYVHSFYMSATTGILTRHHLHFRMQFPHFPCPWAL